MCSGKFTWRVNNFGLFRDMIRVQKIMSPPFPAGDCSLRISVYQSTVGGKEHLSLCLESKVSSINGVPNDCIQDFVHRLRSADGVSNQASL